MAVQAKAPTAAAAVKSAFEDLLQQVNKHKELLRSSHKWARRQKDVPARHNVSVPFEQTLAAVFPATVSADDVRLSLIHISEVCRCTGGTKGLAGQQPTIRKHSALGCIICAVTD